MATTALGLSEKQRALRQHGIGASEVGAIIGVHPSKTAMDIWLAKQQPEEQSAGELAEFGHRIEEVIGDAYVARHPETRIYTPGTLRHRVAEWALASPDRVVAPPGIGRPAKEHWLQLLEIKTVFWAGGSYTDDSIPEHHLAQVQWQLEVADMNHATLVALLNGKYREYPVERDREMGSLLLQIVGDFWERHIVAGSPPEVDGSDAWDAYLRQRYPASRGEFLPATPEVEDLVVRLRALKQQRKALEEGESILEQQLKAFIGEASGIEGLVSWKSNKPSKVTDWEAVAAGFLARLGNEEERRQFLAPFTTTKAGARPLRLLNVTKR